jgi:hypothetical protein
MCESLAERSPVDMTDAEYEKYERAIQAAMETFPDWLIIETAGGLCAVPKDTEIVRAISVDGLVASLREHSKRF